MFDSPLLDVAIGLIFIFLLYSLLATSVQEMIAMVFSLRARMLRTAVEERMLSNTFQGNRWKSVVKGFSEFFLEAWKLISGEREKPESERKIGDRFFEHPLIRNYASSRLFHLPSYIPAHNFSTVLTDVLIKEFDNRLPLITQYRSSSPAGSEYAEKVRAGLVSNTDFEKIREVIESYHRQHYADGETTGSSIIDTDTLRVLELHLHDSAGNYQEFIRRLELWFDDTMNRVSGWYKRQTQVMLFILGVIMAMMFNVDTIDISGRLAVDKEARDRIVDLAIQSTDKYKDDPRIKRIANRNGDILPDTSAAGIARNESIYKEYQDKADTLKAFLDREVKKANELLAIGWGNYGGRNGFFGRTWYVMKQTANGKKLMGLLITAFAICLGAPFWFDLLNRLVKLRATGRKEGPDTMHASSPNKSSPPIIVNVTNPPLDEAVG